MVQVVEAWLESVQPIVLVVLKQYLTLTAFSMNWRMVTVLAFLLVFSECTNEIRCDFSLF